ncbi:MAG: hypothetical protein ABIP53_05080 [Candidatus Limnocylindrales bacterium]
MPQSSPPISAATSPSPTDREPGTTDAPANVDAQPTPAAPDVDATPRPTLPRVAPLQPPAYASRVVVADLRIDLPVISGDLQPPPSYPLCDVAAYVTRFNQPYETGITYISAHAQRNMFAPLLAASERQDGQELIGMRAEVYTSDGRRFTYQFDRVVRHAVDYAVITTVDLAQQTLIVQTSEGPYGTIEKVQVIGSLVEEDTVDLAEANPAPMPRDCEPTDGGEPSAAP